MKKVWCLTVACIVAALAMAGCGTGGDAGKTADGPTASGGQIKVTATTGMIADIVRNVGKEHVAVESLMGPGVDPHLYKATPGDLTKLNSANVIFYNGLHLEGKMADVLEKLGEKKTCVAVGTAVPKEQLLEFAANPEFPDPHIWFNARLWMFAVEKVRDELKKADATHSAEYDTNAETYLKQLMELHQYAAKQIALIPKDRRVLVTAHDAFSYFGKAYGIEVKGLQGISTATEASLQDVQRVVDLLVKRKIRAVFVESSVPRRTVEAVVQGAKARGHEVVIGGELFSDAMGKSGTPEGTYVGMVRHNVDVIVKALK